MPRRWAAGEEVEAALRALLASRPDHPGGIKDGFLRIDLADLGWTELFRADWLWREPGIAGPTVLDWRQARDGRAAGGLGGALGRRTPTP